MFVTKNISGIYIPPQRILERYADVLVNFALGGGKGIKKGDVVRITASESAKPLFIELRKAVFNAGGHVMSNYQPDDDEMFSPSRDFFDCAEQHQLAYFPRKYFKALVDEIDHSIAVLGEADTRALEGVDPKKIMSMGEVRKPMRQWIEQKENRGEYSWTLGLYGTSAMAAEAGLTEKQYWNQIIKACFLDEKHPIAEWKRVTKEINKIRTKLDNLKIESVHVEGDDIDLHVQIGEKRRWKSGSGANIPSFEIFTSPNWRGTNGWVKFNMPLYRYGNLIEGIELKFENGVVVESHASRNHEVLKQMIATQNADKIGEFSLTDKRHSRIDKFMAETLFDENFGGRWGNTHVALGNAYKDCYQGDPSKVTRAEWKRLGYNESSVHTDIISTTRRQVTATLSNGQKKVIYKDGEFVI